jgi:hypothetical protein
MKYTLDELIGNLLAYEVQLEVDQEGVGEKR